MGDSETSLYPGGHGLPVLPPRMDAAPAGISLIESQRYRAIEVLRHCSHESGLQASGKPHGHHQVWARDSMIALLGASQVGDPVIRQALLASLENLKRHQAPNGCIPNHIDTASGRPNFRAYADGGLWFVIGSGILQGEFAPVRRTLRWYECQDVDLSGLISIQEASDWQDLFCTRGKGLYVNCLHVMALRQAALMAEQRGHKRMAAAYRERGERASQAIRSTLWYDGDGRLLRQMAPSFSTNNPEFDSLGRRRWIPPKRILEGVRYYLPYVSFRQVGEWFDTLGNLLAILSGVADAEQSAAILDFLAAHGLAQYPAKAIYPPVEPGSPDWRDYYGTLNLPNEYHNGGIWPFLGGFYVAALVKTGRVAEADRALARLAELNRRSDFCEWCHGETLEASGVPEQAWSAGMYLYAAECVSARSALFF